MTPEEPNGNWKSIKAFIAWTLGCIAAVASFMTVDNAAYNRGWQAAKDTIADELNTLKATQKLDLPKTLESLRLLSATLNAQAIDKAEFERLKSSQSKLEDALRTSTQQTASLQAEIANLRTRLSGYEGDSIDVAAGSSIFIIPGRVALAVRQASMSFCLITLGRESVDLDLGAYISTKEPTGNKRLTLREVSGRVCRFSVSDE